LFLFPAVRSGNGLELWNVANKDSPTAASRVFKPFFKETKPARAMTYSENYFAVGNGTDGVRVFNSKMELKFTAPRMKPYIMKFSPKETFLVVYEIFTSSKENADNPNLFIYETATGAEKCSFVMKRHSEWEPFFAQDESFFAIMLNSEVCFYENFQKTAQKLSGKVGGFSVSPGEISLLFLELQLTQSAFRSIAHRPVPPRQQGKSIDVPSLQIPEPRLESHRLQELLASRQSGDDVEQEGNGLSDSHEHGCRQHWRFVLRQTVAALPCRQR
jgi:hypothetical protein